MRALIAGALGFSQSDADIATVAHYVAERLKAGFETGYTDGGGAHVHTASRGAEIKGDADDFDFAGRQ